ncbi:hypothetical protein [Vibrio fortis]
MKNLMLFSGVICGSLVAVMLFMTMLLTSWWVVDFLLGSHQT